MQVWAGLVPLRPLALAWGRRPLPVSSRGPSLCIRVLTASSHKDTVLWGQGQLGDSFDLNPLVKTHLRFQPHSEVLGLRASL